MSSSDKTIRELIADASQRLAGMSPIAEPEDITAAFTAIVEEAVRRTIRFAPGPYQRDESDVAKIVAAVMGEAASE